MYKEKYWPEEAIKCDSCNEIIQAGWTIWFDDETGIGICDECHNEDLKEW